MMLTERYSQFKLEKASTEVAIIGPIAFPANRLEFRNPITRPSESDAKVEKTKGKTAAIMAVWSMRTATKLTMPGHRESRDWKSVPRKQAAMISLSTLILVTSRDKK